MAERLQPHHLRNVTFVVFDFDGVFTDNSVIVDQDGHESVRCSRADGLGLAALRRLGVGAVILSTERNPVVSQRARKLEIECLQALGDTKGAALRTLLARRELDAAQVAYVGNDVNDLDCLAFAGVSICVPDAHPAALAAAAYVTGRPGGQGAVREVCDLIVEAREAGR